MRSPAHQIFGVTHASAIEAAFTPAVENPVDQVISDGLGI
jgi:hypothetical protein